MKKMLLLQSRNGKGGTIAQMVEQRTENPCVPGSNPGGTTNIKKVIFNRKWPFLLKKRYFCANTS
jgi:hypothetical protein